MAATITLDPEPDGFGVAADVKIRRGVLNLGTYATGGVAVTRGALQLSASVVDLDVRPAGGYVFEWIKSSGKVLAYWQTGVDDTALGEVDDSTDISAVSARFRAEGR